MNELARDELDALAERSGLLTAEAVVEFASNPNTALHKEFTWDNTEAAQKYRLDQARRVIRVYVRFEPRVQRTVRAFVSVPSDRATTGGYRPASAVIDNPRWAMQIAEEVAGKIRNMRGSYAYLKFLDGLWDRLDATVKQYLDEMGQGPNVA